MCKDIRSRYCDTHYRTSVTDPIPALNIKIHQMGETPQITSATQINSVIFHAYFFIVKNLRCLTPLSPQTIHEVPVLVLCHGLKFDEEVLADHTFAHLLEEHSLGIGCRILESQ